eukprot:GEMP01009593.1.p1 GENE.GEMP01009593.1~~GEMP01009593.1.p1  ORF type:complete len:272 (+),score=56.23 GEMP01009593.1:292-1107(+)
MAQTMTDSSYLNTIAAEAESMMADFQETMQAVRQGQVQAELLRSLGIGAEEPVNQKMGMKQSKGERRRLEVNDLVLAPRQGGQHEKAVVIDAFPHTVHVQFVSDQHRTEISRREIDFLSHLLFSPQERDDGVIGFRAQAHLNAPQTPLPVEKPSYMPTEIPAKASFKPSPEQNQLLEHHPAPRPTEAGHKSFWSSANATNGGHYFSQLYSSNFYRGVSDEPAPVDSTNPRLSSTPFVRRCVVALDGTEKTWNGEQLSHWLTEPRSTLLGVQ